MELCYPRCAALDVHKKTVVACRLHTPPDGRVEKETRTFGTMTEDLLALLDWLLAWGCTHVALESTGEYWRPVYNVLEGHCALLLVNARHFRQVPGRKTDVKDAEWMAELLRFGLLRASFVPPKPQRHLRALTRQRSNLVAERAMVVNWVQKTLEDANIKLAAVATDVLGVSGREMLEALIAGETDAAKMAELARTQMRRKIPELTAALTGTVDEHHRFLLTQHLHLLDFLDGQIAAYSAQIGRHLEALSAAPPQDPEPEPGPPPSLGERLPQPQACPKERRPRPDVPPPPPSYLEAVALLDPIPGLDRRVIENILAEIGVDMGRFGTAGRLTSWGGVAPGNRVSGGKRYSGKTPPGNPALRKALVQAAHGARRAKGSYFRALYARVTARRDKNERW